MHKTLNLIWNDHSLLTTNRQGSESNLRLHLAAYDFVISLKKFIQLSNRVAHCVQGCMEHREGQQSSFPPCQPEYVSSPEPASEPMQINSARLTTTERQRGLTQGLCLYCGAKGHIISPCPICPCPMGSVVHSPHINSTPLTTIVCLTASNVPVSVSALIDSGSASNFISGELCHYLKLKKTCYETQYKVHSIPGMPLRHVHVHYCVRPLKLKSVDSINFLVLEKSTADSILGCPFLI